MFDDGVQVGERASISRALSNNFVQPLLYSPLPSVDSFRSLATQLVRKSSICASKESESLLTSFVFRAFKISWTKSLLLQASFTKWGVEKTGETRPKWPNVVELATSKESDNAVSSSQVVKFGFDGLLELLLGEYFINGLAELL